MSAQSPIVDPPSAFIGFEALVALLHGLFVKHGTSPEVAAILARNCASAERDGAHSHGIFRIPGYLSTLASGWVDGQAVPQVTDVASGFVRVDAGNGFAQPALEAARARCWWTRPAAPGLPCWRFTTPIISPHCGRTSNPSPKKAWWR